MALPPPRRLLTSLINSIAAIPLDKPPPPPATSSSRTAPAGSDTLSRVPPSHRHFLITLHVLFPSLVLPALDLLDRGLVERISLLLSSNEASSETRQERPSPTGENTFYLVRSASQLQTSSSSLSKHHHWGRRRTGRQARGLEAAGKDGEAVASFSGFGHAPPQQRRRYAVRLGAWNCTCAAFAFGAFPPLAAVTSSGEGVLMPIGKGDADNVDLDGTEARLGLGSDRGLDADRDEVADGDEEAWWSFGGTCLDGRSSGDVGDEGAPPLCKHLLACLLAERWGAALGSYVVERKVKREEMAGLVADT